MRKVLIFCIILFIILAATPLIASYIPITKAEENKTDTSTAISETEKPQTDEEQILAYAISISDEDFCDEGLKAALAIAENNYLCTDYKDNTESKEYSDEFYQRVRKIYEELDVRITYNGENVYIPTSSLSSGRTETDSKYPYMKAVASPWDSFSEEFVYDKDYLCGVSMYGLDYLCSEGMSYKESLGWYLPEFDIK